MCSFSWPETAIPCASKARWVVISGTNGTRRAKSCCDGHLLWMLHDAMREFGTANVIYALGAVPPEEPST